MAFGWAMSGVFFIGHAILERPRGTLQNDRRLRALRISFEKATGEGNGPAGESLVGVRKNRALRASA
ncbi:hypothetical protein MPC4_130098 [Methylocella tundrae]|uniref:Uncharacterized protein n=2 Tax=Methylocella tundrae TaxID=227605 RepID=A0A8B6M237_METTU|nr:hypothetical protein MPC1_2980004 [Methylocella tundrae]VTZ49077.1 hypothetical protein MPC4_130098 [Methylocella tundrae]